MTLMTRIRAAAVVAYNIVAGAATVIRPPGSVASRSYVYDSISVGDPALAALFGIAPSSAGVEVTKDRADELTAWFSGVQLISSIAGLLPLELVCRTVTKGVVVQEDHYLVDLLRQPNPHYTYSQWMERKVRDMLVHGDAFDWIERNKSEDGGLGTIRNLWPLHPDDIKVTINGAGRKVFTYHPDQGDEKVYDEDEILHTPGYGYEGLRGVGLYHYAVNNIALGLATEAFGRSFFGNNSVPGAVVTHPMELKSTTKLRLEEEIEKRLKTPARARSILLLDEGMKMEQVGVPPNEGQFLETRQFQVREIARVLRIPPHMLYDAVEKSWTTEQNGIEFVAYTMEPWITRILGPMRQRLLTTREARKYYFRALTDRVTPMDRKTRYETYGSGRNMGLLSLNDMRNMEEMPLLDPAIGDTLIGPSTMKALGSSDPTVPISAETLTAIVVMLKTLQPSKSDAKRLVEAAVPFADEDTVRAIIRSAGTMKDDAPELQPTTNGGSV